MDERTSGLILRTRPLTDTSLIVHWLTPELGRLSTVAKGARRPKSPFQGKLDLFYEAEFSLHRSLRSELHTLREVQLVDAHSFLRQNLTYLQQTAYCAGLIEKITEPETPVAEYFELLTGFLKVLPLRPPTPLPVLAFEIKCLEVSGLRPEIRPAFNTNAAELLADLVALDWNDLIQLKPPSNLVLHISAFLKKSLENSFDRLPSGRADALSISASE